jgi:iron(III) transport system substrate-binding protein
MKKSYRPYCCIGPGTVVDVITASSRTGNGGLKMASYKHSLLSGLLIAGVAAALPSLTIAAPKTIKEVANYMGADRQAVMEAGAKKEGTVLVYGSLTQGTAGPVFAGFVKKYPFIRLQKKVGDSITTVRQAVEEFRAQHYIVDVVGTSLGGMLPLRELGFFMPYRTPEHAAMRPEAIEPNRLWTMDFQSFVSLGYNTKEVSEKDVPKTLDDLLDPKWKGKMAFPKSSTFPNWVGATLHEKDEKWLRKLAKQNIRVYKIGGRALSNLVVSGEVSLSPTIFNSHMYKSASKGASVSWRPLGPVHTNTSTMGLAKHAPHPHAGMLLIDYFMSKEGQSIRKKLGYASGRKDLPLSNPPKNAIDQAISPTYSKDFIKWRKLAFSIFGKPQPKK